MRGVRYWLYILGLWLVKRYQKPLAWRPALHRSASDDQIREIGTAMRESLRARRQPSSPRKRTVAQMDKLIEDQPV